MPAIFISISIDNNYFHAINFPESFNMKWYELITFICATVGLGSLAEAVRELTRISAEPERGKYLGIFIVLFIICLVVLLYATENREKLFE